MAEQIPPTGLPPVTKKDGTPVPGQPGVPPPSPFPPADPDTAHRQAWGEDRRSTLPDAPVDREEVESLDEPLKEDNERNPKDAQLDPEPSLGTVHIPALISDEFGVSRDAVRDQINAGVVTVDDVEVTDRDKKFDIPVEEIENKWLAVEGPDRSFRVRYRPQSE